MKNVQKEGSKDLEVITPDTKETVTKPGTPTAVQAPVQSKKEDIENTLNYLNATYSLLQGGLFIGKDTNTLIQVKAWIENQQKVLSLQMARVIASEADNAEKKNG